MKVITIITVTCTCFWNLIVPAHAQSANPYYGYSYETVDWDESIKLFKSRMDQLANQTVPKNELALMHELDRLDPEITKLNFQVEYAKRVSEEPARFAGLFSELTQKRSHLVNFDCDANLHLFKETARNYSDAFNKVHSTGDWIPGINLAQLRLPPAQDTDKETCTTVKQHLAGNDFGLLFNEASVKATDAYSVAKQDSDKLVEVGKQLYQKLTERRNSLLEALNNSSAQQNIIANLPVILGILAGACVLAIVGVKLFDKTIQMEWVASGQLIQFVTVMILLSVVTALGLSNILQETTLGTLLGGIAGYVLAQGVGRAAARDASRGQGIQ